MWLSSLETFLAQNHFPPFRFRQISKNYFSGKYDSFLDMTDLPLALRHQLQNKFSLYDLKLDQLLQSSDTKKARLLLSDGQKIETVLMNYDNWSTICLSSQVGCPLKCKFCATGQMGFIRNLTVAEILDQILFWKHFLISPSSRGDVPTLSGQRGLDERLGGGLRLVFMGMGEPFLNWDNLLEALKIINSPDGLNIGQRKISISTAGIVPKIRQFANLKSQINLAVSLHAPDQSTRLKLMPIAQQYSLTELLDACLDYVTTTRRQLFFEYALIKGINDSPARLRQLIKLIKSHYLFHLNLIPLNPIKGGLTPSSNLHLFESELTRNHTPFTIRHSFGQNIASACGQLVVQP